MKKTMHNHLSLYLSLLLMSFSAGVSAQNIDLGFGGSPEELADLITGNGVQILNPSITCADSAYGTYDISAIPNFDSGTGLVLSTGNIIDMYGPNLSSSTTTEWGTPGDPLINVISGGTSFDACVFEFDIIPIGDTIRFNFTFASEEYEEYVGTVFNDAFGFFISGPGIDGTPGLGAFENIALIPGTSIPVSINTVNNGNPDIGFPPQNPEFFVSNPPGFNTVFEYDGWTTGLFAERVVTACDTFRLKLAIADVGDRRWDSSVFVEAIESSGVTLTATTDGEIDDMIKGCNNGTVTFTRSPVTANPLEVVYFIGGTAINGGDYPLIGGNPDPDAPKTITIPANEATASINIAPFETGVQAGDLTFIVYIGNPLCPGTITDSLVVNILEELLVSVNPPLSFICEGDSLTFTVNDGGTAFSWEPPLFLNDPNIMEPTASPPQDQEYTVTTTVSDCIASATAEIRVSVLEISSDVSNIECGGDEDGAINVSVTGGETPYEFNWTGPDGFSSSDQNIFGLSPGVYSLVVEDREGCTDSVSFTLSENVPLELVLSSPEFAGGNNVSCNGATDGQATVMVSGGNPPYTFQWNDPGNQSGATATNLAAGTYTVTVTDQLGCESSGQITLTQPDPVSGVLDERIDVACFGESTGFISILPQGGTPPYTFLWNTSPPQSGASISNVAAGIYTVTITDVNGCIGFAEVTVSEPDAPLSASISTTPATCPGDSDGSAVASVSGGTPPYSYTWSPDPGTDSPSIGNLSAGSYSLLITDANDCTLSVPFNISQPNPILISVVQLNDVSCLGGSDASILVNATGGNGGFSYTWDTDPETLGPELSGVGVGTYTVTATDQNGCEESLEIVIEEPDEELSISIVEEVNPTCSGDSDGSIEVIAEGGTAPYTYSWNTVPPTSGNSLDNLSEGTYIVTATDANNCMASQSITLVAPDEIIISTISIQNVLCQGEATGAASVEATGGVPPYSFAWNDPASQTGPSAENLAAGSYTVTVTDGVGCTASLQVTISEPSAPLSVAIISSSDVLCFGESNGSATAQASGGSGSYSYQWDDPAAQQTPTASNLPAGTYTVTVFDNNGCETPATASITIGGPDEELELDLDADIASGGANIACAGDSTGSITLTITGGTAPFTVEWSLPDGSSSTSQNLEDLGAGTYSVSVIDANGCEATGSISLDEAPPIEISFETVPTLCFGAPTGSIDLEVSGGTPPYAIEWDGPGGFSSTDQNLENLVGGIYLLTITDANGCVLNDAVTVVQPEDIVINVDSISDINGFNTSCWNSQDASIFVSTTGGTPAYFYTWNAPGNPGFSNQQNVSNLGAGTYEVVVIDQNDCVQSEFIEVIAPDTLKLDFELSLYDNGFNISCNGESDGSVEATASGGAEPYTYTWIGAGGFGPVNDNPIENIPAGAYSVLAQDANACFISEEIVLIEPPAFSISLVATEINGSNISCEGESDGSIDLIIQGSTGPYSISWTGPDDFTSNDEDLFNLAAGTYCVEVIDVNDCSQEACITLEEPEELELSLIPFVFPNGANLSCGGAADGSIDSQVSGGTAPYSYSWIGPSNFTSTEANPQDLIEGTYCLTVTDANGCTAQECATLVAEPELEVEVNIDSSLLCEGDDSGGISATVTGGIEPYAFSWTGPDGFAASTQNIENLESGLYCLTVTDAEGCSSQACAELIAPQILELELSALEYSDGNNLSCNGANDGSISGSLSGGMAPYSFSWSGPGGFTANTLAIDGLAAGEYCLTVIDANDCEIEECITLTEPDPLLAFAEIDLPDCADGSLADVNITVSGGTAPYAFNWSSGDSGNSAQLGPGSYSVIVSDQNGCETTVSFTIAFPDPINIVLESPIVPGGFNVDCNGAESGQINPIVSGGQGNLSYLWTFNGGSFSNEEGLIIGLAAGTYCLTVTDSLGCNEEACIELTEPEPLTVEFTEQALSCPGGSDGSITASVSGGVASYSYTWTGPNGFTASGAGISGIEAGEYCVSISDVNACVLDTCITLEEPDEITITLDSPEEDGVNIACFEAASGSITAEVSGGSEPYSFSWTGPEGFTSTDLELDNLTAGEYCLLVTDAEGCEQEACIELIENPGIDLSLDLDSFPNGFNISCAGECDGSLSVELQGGSPPYVLEWQGPDGFSSSDTELNNLCAGTYTLLTTDANGCEESFEITLNEPEDLLLSLEVPLFPGGTAIPCVGDENAVINTTVEGGIAPYSYSWTGPDGFNSDEASLENLGPGSYTLVVSDAGSCTATQTVLIEEPDEILGAAALPSEFPSGDNISCFGAEDGSITASASGGTEPYTFNWFGPDDFTAQGESIENLGPGEYALIVEDLNSCTFTIVLQLTEPDTFLTAFISDTTLINCHNEAQGALSVFAEGGSPDYTINWIGPNNFSSTNFSIENLSPGTYTFAVSDVNSCSVSGAFELLNPPPIVADADITPAICLSETGSIEVSFAGGTPPYTFLWEDGSIGSGLNLVAAGTYSLLVTDDNGCEENFEFTINEINNLEIDVSITPLSCAGDSTGVLQAQLSTGATPVSYSWSGPDGFSQSGNTIVDLAAGNYELTAIDDSGCILEETYIVPEPDTLSIANLTSPLYNNGFNLSGFQSQDGAVNAPQVTGGTSPFQFLWSGPDGFTSQDISGLGGLQAGTYELVVIDANGCLDTADVTLTQPVPLELPNGISPNGDGFNDGLIVRGLEDFSSNKLLVYNRWGSLLYEEANYSNSSPWMGTNNSGGHLPEGTYFVIVELEGRDALRGYLELRR